VLGTVEWSQIGEHMAAMVPLCEEIAASLLEGKGLPSQAVGDAQKHNAVLVPTALEIHGKLPGTGANGAFTHPAFMANAIEAALRAAGMPLSRAQLTQLEELARRFADEDRRRLEGYAEDTFQLRRTVDEGDLRRRFSHDAMALLTPAQHERLRPPAIRDRLQLDLYSEAIFWGQFVRPARGEGRAEVATAASGALLPALGLTAEQEAAARAVVSDWASRLPAALVERTPDALDEMGMLHASVVRDSAVETLALLRRLVTEVPLEGDSAAKARGFGAALVPWR